MTKDGVGFFRIGIDSSIPDVLQFGSLSVEELYRGQGRGKELLRESKLIFQLSDCDFMELWVEENSWMENWYYREGFKEYGTDFSSEPHYKTMRFGKPLDTNNLLKEYHLA